MIKVKLKYIHSCIYIYKYYIRIFMFLYWSEIFLTIHQVEFCLKSMTSILHPIFMLGNDHISSVQAGALNTRETVSCENYQ